MLVSESLWSRRLYISSPVAHSDLLAHLGRELALVYGSAMHEPIPEQWSQLLRRLDL
jgi:hypothetical protein